MEVEGVLASSGRLASAAESEQKNGAAWHCAALVMGLPAGFWHTQNRVVTLESGSGPNFCAFKTPSIRTEPLSSRPFCSSWVGKGKREDSERQRKCSDRERLEDRHAAAAVKPLILEPRVGTRCRIARVAQMDAPAPRVFRVDVAVVLVCVGLGAVVSAIRC